MFLNKNSVDKFFQVSKELLLEIAEDHEEADLVAQMINELVKWNNNFFHIIHTIKRMNSQIRWLFKGPRSLKSKQTAPVGGRVGDHRKFGGTKELMDQKTVIVVLESWGNQSAEGTKQWRRQNNSINWKTRNLICTGKLSVSKYTITKCAFLSFVAYVEIYALFGGPNGPKICGRGTKLI